MLISDLKNSRTGTIGFVIGAGPSLHFQNLNLLKGHTRIAVNSGIRAVPDAEFFLTGDPVCAEWDYWNEEVLKGNAIKLFQSLRMNDVAKSIPEEKKCFYHCQPPHDPHYDDKSIDRGLDMSIESKIIGARTSAGPAVHFAKIMGCNPIVLLGCDAKYIQGKRYFWQFPGWKKVVSTTSYRKVFAKPNSGHINGNPVDQHCRDFLDYWKAVADTNKNIKIINASTDSLIDAFPKMNLSEVIKRYGT